MANEKFYWHDDNDTNKKMSTVEENGRILTRGIIYSYGKQRDKRSDTLTNYSRNVSKGKHSLCKAI